MPPKSPDPIAHPPTDPSFPLGATSNEAEMKAQIANNKLGGPGDIVSRLGQQFTYPRASPDSNTGDRGYGGNNLGEIG